MGYKLLTLTIALTLALTQVQAEVPCPYEECSCTRRSIDCRNLGLTALPVLKNGSYPQTSLYIEYNQISSISGGQLPGGLTNIYASGNQISHISDDAFTESAHTLNYLKLYDNQLTQIPELGYLHNLEDLGLYSNRITDISTFTFPSSLVMLDLFYNQIENISSIAFQNETSALTYLYLGSNPISHISDDAFSQLTKLKTLYLTSPHLTRLPLALMTLTNLTDLEIRYNFNMACTCAESALASWYHDLPKRYLHINGDCYGDHYDVEYTVGYFLAEVAPYCVKPCV